HQTRAQQFSDSADQLRLSIVAPTSENQDQRNMTPRLDHVSNDLMPASNHRRWFLCLTENLGDRLVVGRTFGCWVITNIQTVAQIGFRPMWSKFNCTIGRYPKLTVRTVDNRRRFDGKTELVFCYGKLRFEQRQHLI